jgi:23S rRNA pseudouridine1911/1915/1917 synthase
VVGSVRFIVGEAEDGQRVDVVLAEQAGASRSQARRWIESGLVQVGGRTCRPSRRVVAGEEVHVEPPEPVAASLAPEPIPVTILYEDEDLVVLDKPAGLVVHPAPGHPGGTLVNALLHHCGDLAGIGGVLRPGIVHRLDRGTSGVLVVAKRDTAHVALARQFHDHSVEREYRALVRGVPTADAGRVDRPIGRHPRDRKRMSVHARRGREAHTAWRVLQRFRASDHSWLAILPETGRTHQIRVHLAAAGLPVAGDRVYGRARRDTLRLERPALHAQRLGFAHPRSGEWLRFEAPLPPDLAAALAELARREERS